MGFRCEVPAKVNLQLDKFVFKTFDRKTFDRCSNDQISEKTEKKTPMFNMQKV